MATATAMTECEIMRLDKAAIIRVLHEEPAFSEMFVSHLLARTIRVEADLADQLFNSSEHGGGARPRGVARCSAPLSIRMALGGR
jgi:CRP-like cAMP-binding protein